MPAATSKTARRRHRRNANTTPPPSSHHDASTATSTATSTASSSSSSSSTSVPEARAKFVASVTRGLSVLMERGFSRERATAVLLREMARPEEQTRAVATAASSFSSSSTKPSDQEVFECMSQYGLGLDGASKALTVSKLVQCEMTQRKVSMLNAIDGLTSKLATANLVASTVASSSDSMTSTMLPSDNDEVVAGITVRPTSSSRSSNKILPILAPARQPPIPANTKTASTSSKTTATTNIAPVSSSTRKTRASTKNTNKQKNTGSSARKRSVDETKSEKNSNNNNSSSSSSLTKKDDNNNNAPSRRGRSDSLSEVVEAKFGGSSAGSNSETTPVEPAPAVMTRSKRARAADDGENSAAGSALKRSRTTSAGEM